MVKCNFNLIYHLNGYPFAFVFFDFIFLNMTVRFNYATVKKKQVNAYYFEFSFTEQDKLKCRRYP